MCTLLPITMCDSTMLQHEFPSSDCGNFHSPHCSKCMFIRTGSALLLFANAINRMEFLNGDPEAGDGAEGKDEGTQKPTYKKLAIVGAAFFGFLLTAKTAAYAIKEYRVCSRFCCMVTMYTTV